MPITHCESDFFNYKISPELKISIVLPVKNEEDGIGSTLRALANQLDDLEQQIPYQIYEVLVLVNNCSDQTFGICEAFRLANPDMQLHIECIELPIPVAHVGTARKLLMDAACQRLIVNSGPRGIIASTDGDSQVDPYWIFHTLREMKSGVDVVGGRIIPLNTPKGSKPHHLRDVAYRLLSSRLEAQLDPCQLNPWPRHFQCYGPSLAVTCDIYQRAGGIQAIPYLEDEEFRKSLKRIDAKFRNSPFVKIYTSSRTQGRVEFGFSIQLQIWETMTTTGAAQMVESLNTLIFKFEVKKKLRDLWLDCQYTGLVLRKHLTSLTLSTGIDFCWMTDAVKTSTYFEMLWERVEGHLHNSDHPSIQTEPINVAIGSLRNYFNKNEIEG